MYSASLSVCCRSVAKLGVELRVKYSNTHRYILQGKMVETLTNNNVFIKVGGGGYTTTALVLCYMTFQGFEALLVKAE